MALGSTYTITFGDVCENGVGMQQIGERCSNGISVNELKDIQAKMDELGYGTYYIDLTELCPPELLPEEAGLLYIRDGIDISGYTHDELLAEQNELDYDKQKFSRGRVVNSRARYNICFADFEQEPNYECKQGRVVNFDDLPALSALRSALPIYFGDACASLNAEGNLYYDLSKTGIGFHGDTERKIVIAARFGSPMRLSFAWYHQSKHVGKQIKLTIPPGGMYIMSSKAVGNDWKRKLIPTLRHAAGCESYLKIK